MGEELYAAAFTWTWLGFSPGEGLNNQTPVIVPFWLLYPLPAPVHPKLPLSPLAVVAFEGEPPHPITSET
jgi:hypothetical protein